jgi:hypothetical protein
MKPTQEQIEQEIAKLKDLQPNVKHYSSFGDDNQAQIAAQIQVLADNLDADDITERYIVLGESLYEAAISARDWLNGEYGPETLSEDWEGLDTR